MSVVLILLLVTPTLGHIGSRVKESFTFKPIEKYVEDKGYTIEKHILETGDGFLLTYHRIPYGKQGPDASHGHPVLLAHGILQSSALYLAMDDGLAYLLADEGFDVWLMNARGNTYSKRHNELKESSKEFWDFSFHEMGEKDLPVAIEHILTTTGRQTLSYIGFSMGTTMFWILADSWGPKYMDKVDTMVAMAPIARPSGMTILKYATILKAGLKTYELARSYEVRSFHRTGGLFVRALCSSVSSIICTKVTATLVGLYSDSIHHKDTYESTQYMPAGTSVKNVRHFLQIGKKESFQQFDYGEEKNEDHYPTSSPPVYNLKKVTCPVFFVTSNKDEYSVKKDVDWLAEQLPEKPEVLFFDKVNQFDHLDYFYSKDLKSNLYTPLVEFLVERTKKDYLPINK